MTQKEIDAVFDITIFIYEHEWFKNKKPTRNDVQTWVADQLAKSIKVYSIPIGSSWGVLVNKEHYDEFHNPKEEDNDNN